MSSTTGGRNKKCPKKLRPSHRVSERGLHSNFLSVLNKGTKTTATSHQEVVDKRAINFFLFTNLASNLSHEPKIRKWDEGHCTAQQTIIANRLGCLAENVARSTVSCQAQWDIIQAATQTITPLLGHVEEC